MNKILCLLNVLLISIIVFNYSINNKYYVIATDLNVKQLKSEKLTKVSDREEDIVEEEIDSVLVTEVSTDSIKDEVIYETEIEDEPEVNVNDVLETVTGKMSGYGPDCIGCSGYLASGKYVGDGNIYYEDATYGKVRILAGDRKYAFGTIVRIKSAKFEEDILAIVLDRGGSIGVNKKYMFDLLFDKESVAYNFGVSYETRFEVLRYGY